MYILVSPFKNSFDDLGLIYFVDDIIYDQIKIGQIIEIPLKENIELAVIIKIFESNYENNNLKIKSIIGIFNHNVFLSSSQIELVFWISQYYFSFIHDSLNLFFPKNLISKIKKQKLDLLNHNEFIYKFVTNINLTENQNKALREINESKNNKILFYGLTGSGKTEIYIELIKKYLDLGKQTLLLLPEIILNNQISTRLEKVFGKNFIIINSSISDANKTKNWINIYNNNAKIIIGTRSALFYPYNNLGLIIIDEQHDNSYISDSKPRYNSIEVAEKITRLNNNKLILASGTPSIQSMYSAIKREYYLVNLLDKYKK